MTVPATRPPRQRLRLSLTDLRGQALVEFVAVLLPLLLIITAIVQFGLLFGANVTLTNAVREGARAGSIYVFDRTQTRSWNDAHRCATVLTAARNAFGLESTSSPYFTVATSSGGCVTTGGETQVDSDLTISYCARSADAGAPCPDPLDSTTICTAETREGCFMQVGITYRSDLVVPLIGQLLSTDANGRFVQRAAATMVVN